MPELMVFEVLFDVRPGEPLTPRIWVQIEGVRYGPGAALPSNFKPAGVPINEWWGRKIWGHREGEVFVVDAVSREA